jgi:hypothetical protein
MPIMDTAQATILLLLPPMLAAIGVAVVVTRCVLECDWDDDEGFDPPAAPLPPPLMPFGTPSRAVRTFPWATDAMPPRRDTIGLSRAARAHLGSLAVTSVRALRP